MKPYIVALTGASGIQYGIRLIISLMAAGKKVAAVMSEPARLVLREEAGIVLDHPGRAEAWYDALDLPSSGSLETYSNKDLAAPVASGSYPVEAMVICPCSMSTLAAVASGFSQNLIHRAADCVIKEGRPLVIVPRETPLNAIHLENMLKLARLGVKVVPAMPGFYSGAGSISDLVDFMTGKILDQLGVEHALYPRWTGSMKGSRRE